MNKRKVILVGLLIISVAGAFWYTVNTFFRLEMIKLTMDAELPWWLLRALWGW